MCSAPDVQPYNRGNSGDGISLKLSFTKEHEDGSHCLLLEHSNNAILENGRRIGVT
jgi:hypothetical protein